MNVVPGLLALLLVGFDGTEAPQTASFISFQLSYLEMDSLDWRSPLYHRLKAVDRQGGATVWITGADTAQALRNRAAHTEQAPRFSLPLDATGTIVVKAAERYYVAGLERVANAPRHLASKLAFRPEQSSVREGLRANVCAHRTAQGLLTKVTCDATWLAAFHTVPLSELYVDEQGIEAGTISAQLQLPEVTSAHVNGEWLIPSGQVLVVSLGVSSVVDAMAFKNGEAGGGAKVCERLVIFEPISTSAPSSPPSAQPPPLSQAPRRDPFPTRSYADIVTHVDSVPSAPSSMETRLTPVSSQRLAAMAAAPRVNTLRPKPEPPLSSEGVTPACVDELPLPPLPDAQANPASTARTAGASHAAGAKAGTLGSAALVRSSEESSWPLTLAEAICIRLEHADGVRVVCTGAPGEPMVIAPVTPGSDEKAWQFKAAVVEMVRSVEEQYWALAQRHALLESRGKQVKIGEEILERELAEPEHGTADKAKIRQRLESLRSQLVTATSGVITTERQLRTILGLPPADNRRIVPETAPTKARIEPDWESDLAQMISFQPGVAQSRALVERTEREACLSLEAPTMVGDAIRGDSSHGKTTATSPELAQRQQAQRALVEARESYKQVLHEMGNSLSRACVEVDMNYKQFENASQLRAVTEERLASQQSEYEVGRITADRYLEAVNEWGNAIAEEARFQFSYNASIAAYEAAKGTLLSCRNIYADVTPAGVVKRETGSPTRSFALRLSPRAPMRINTVVSPSGLPMPEMPSRSLPMDDSMETMPPLPDDSAARTSLSTRSTEPLPSAQAVNILGRAGANPSAGSATCDLESTEQTCGVGKSQSRWTAVHSGTMRIPIGGNMAIEIKATAKRAPKP